MKKIKYNTEYPRVFEKGTYRGYTYYITEGGIAPCAYVVLPRKLGGKDHPFYKKSVFELPFIPVHGGITYNRTEFRYDDVGEDSFVIGWDYGHGLDYTEYKKELVKSYKAMGLELKKYTYKDIIFDIKICIKYLEGDVVCETDYGYIGD